MATPKTPDITVYFLQASRCIRTVWLLEELGIPYKLEFADRVNKKAPPEFKQASGNPLGKFPVIKDGDLVVHESGAITEYICDHYDISKRLLPSATTHPTERSQVQTYIHASEGTLGIHALAIMYTQWNLPSNLKQSNPEILEQMEGGMSVNVRNDMDWLENEVQKSASGFLVGDGLTAADIMMAFTVRFVLSGGFGTKGRSWPKVEEWVKKCENTESYKRAVEKSGHSLASMKS